MPDRLEQLRGDGCQKVPAAAGGEESHPFPCQRHQAVVGRFGVVKPITREDFVDRVDGRFGVEDQVDHGGGDLVVGERIVQQVIENLTVDSGDLVEVGLKLV